MTKRLHSMIFSGAASAWFACAGPAMAAPADESLGLPQWVLRAQQRLALNGEQQRELRELVSANSEKLHALATPAQRSELAELQREFRAGLAHILTPEQLIEWDLLLEELLGAVHLRNQSMLAAAPH